MTSPLEDLIRYRLNRANETFIEAETLAENGHFHGAPRKDFFAGNRTAIH